MIKSNKNGVDTGKTGADTIVFVVTLYRCCTVYAHRNYQMTQMPILSISYLYCGSDVVQDTPVHLREGGAGNSSQ